MNEIQGPVGAQGDELARLRTAIDAINDGFQIISFEWRYLYVNAAVLAHGRLTREELLGRTMMECYPGIEHSDMFHTLERCMATRSRETMDNEFVYADGERNWFEVRVEPCAEGLSILSVDVTERKTLEAQLRQAMKMEAVGRLAGGVAHDFNNLLSVILSYSSMVLSENGHSEMMRADIGEIQKAGERGADLTKQLLAFSRQQVLELRTVNLNQVVGELEPMIRRILGEDVHMKVILRSDLGDIKADPGHLDQVIMNLVVNARDAMPQGGDLTIETSNEELDASYTRQHVGARPGAHVMVAISDTGTGIDRATQERIFEPFFTTKEKGKGTGLGLSTVYGIVKQAGGNIWVYSEPGQGTTFKIYFPRGTGDVKSPTVHIATVSSSGGSETILLVEDDAQVRALARTILHKHGYRVLEADGGAAAMRMCVTHAGAIDLMLTDVVMPEMSGRQVAEAARLMRPEMRILYMSGYTDDAIVQHRVLEAGVYLLQKPITPDSLLHKIRQVIDSAKSGD